MKVKKIQKSLLILTLCCITIFLAGFNLTSCSSSSDSGGSSSPVSPSPTLTISPTISPTPTPSPYPTPQPELPKKKVTVGTAVLTCEIADAPDERQYGLSWRRSLGENDGMLFVYSVPENAGIWMYGMLFNLDVIWINGDTVVYIHENVPAPENPYNTNIPTYSPDQPVDNFLEVNAGFVKKHGIKTGDKMKIEEL